MNDDEKRAKAEERLKHWKRLPDGSVTFDLAFLGADLLPWAEDAILVKLVSAHSADHLRDILAERSEPDRTQFYLTRDAALSLEAKLRACLDSIGPIPAREVN